MDKNPTTTTVKTPADNFTGDVWMNPVFSGDGTSKLTVGHGQRDEQIRPTGHEDHGQTFTGFDVGGRILMHVGAFLLSQPLLLSRRAPSRDGRACAA
jgi:hypothetical protein